MLGGTHSPEINQQVRSLKPSLRDRFIEKTFVGFILFLRLLCTISVTVLPTSSSTSCPAANRLKTNVLEKIVKICHTIVCVYFAARYFGEFVFYQWQVNDIVDRVPDFAKSINTARL